MSASKSKSWAVGIRSLPQRCANLVVLGLLHGPPPMSKSPSSSSLENNKVSAGMWLSVLSF